MPKKFSVNPIEDFYKAIAAEDESLLKEIHIPHSSVFYAREAYYNYSGIRVSLEEMEKAMILEGMILEE